MLDLSVASPMLSGDTRQNDEPSLTRRVDEIMRDAGVRVSIGRYDEPRLLYVAPAFALGPRLTDEHRTIHIGLDLFADAGTPVFAPLDGEIAAFNDNGMNQDYGPVIILRHRTDDGTEFFTLYGHLSRESLDGLSIGKRVKAGDRIATLGAANVNGGWTPHLHLQIITDLLELGTDFPGVAPPAQRAAWTSLCPDPNLIVRVPAERFPRGERSRRESLTAREKAIGGNLSLVLSRACRGRARLDAVPVRPRRAAVRRRVQQRSARRPLSSARRRSGGATDARVEHEHALPERAARALRGGAAGDDAARRSRSATSSARRARRTSSRCDSRARRPDARTRSSSRPRTTATRRRSSTSVRTSTPVRAVAARPTGSTSRRCPTTIAVSIDAATPTRGRSTRRTSARSSMN